MASSSRPKCHLFPKGFWNPPRLDLNRQGDENAEMIYAAVGEALSAWESFESQLADAFLKAHGRCSESTGAMIERSFSCVETSSTRVRMLDAVIHCVFDGISSGKPCLSDWVEIERNIMFASWLRNQIAHGKCEQRIEHKGLSDGSTEIKKFGFFLVAPSYSGRHREYYFPDFIRNTAWTTKSTYAFSSTDVKQFTQRMSRLRDAIQILMYQAVAISDHVIRQASPEVLTPEYLFSLLNKT